MIINVIPKVEINYGSFISWLQVTKLNFPLLSVTQHIQEYRIPSEGMEMTVAETSNPMQFELRPVRWICIHLLSSSIFCTVSFLLSFLIPTANHLIIHPLSSPSFLNSIFQSNTEY